MCSIAASLYTSVLYACCAGRNSSPLHIAARHPKFCETLDYLVEQNVSLGRTGLHSGDVTVVAKWNHDRVPSCDVTLCRLIWSEHSSGHRKVDGRFYYRLWHSTVQPYCCGKMQRSTCPHPNPHPRPSCTEYVTVRTLQYGVIIVTLVLCSLGAEQWERILQTRNCPIVVVLSSTLSFWGSMTL